MLIFFLNCTTPEVPIQTQIGERDEWSIVGMEHQVRASSTFEEGVLDYPAMLASDGDPKSAWCAERNDTQPTLEVSSSCTAPLLALRFYNGFAESTPAYKQRKRIRDLKVELEVDGISKWSADVILRDTIQPQYITLPNLSCTTRLSIRLKIDGAYPANGPICLAEVQAMHSSQTPPTIITFAETQQVECRPKTSVRFYAGPSTSYTLLGVAAILLTEHGAPYLRVVETQGGWARVDRIRRQFLPKENPPKLRDPKWGGWVQTSLLECLEDLK